ncbi:MAG: thioredoxin family protein [Pyrinomonadaceae bacterium]
MTKTKFSEEFEAMESYVEKAMSFEEYIGLLDSLLARNETTGTNQSEKMVGFGKLNRQRMKRLMNTYRVPVEVRETANSLSRPLIWLILTEGWCGDAAQNIPVIEKIAEANDLIETRYLLRDENIELMDRNLTNGARSIPKLICLDGESLAELGTWGPRPKPAMELFIALREEGVEKDEILERVQRWYLNDKERSATLELGELLKRWS